jgi:coenzyme F420 hydrogenase subunit beta
MMQALGPKELLEDVIEKNLCVGCGACIDLCPYFKTHRGRTTMLFPCDLSMGQCYAFCPKAEVDLDALAQHCWGKPYDADPIGQYRQVLTARAGDRMTRGPFQAGGSVSAILTFALENGMIDSAVLTDREGMVPLPRLVSNTEDVIKCASSKYMAAPTLAALNRAVREGHGQIGVVGTPCQVTALRQMGSNPLGRPDFSDPISLVVGLFCTWALDTRDLIAELSKRLDIRGIQKMDIPPPPAEVFVVETVEGRIQIPLAEIRPLAPGGCLICPDMTSEWADISVGVLEGAPEWNTLIIRTERGQELVDKATKNNWLITGNMPAENLSHLNFAAGNKKKRALTRCLEQGLVNTENGNGRSAMRISTPTLKEIIGGGEE